ncbi:MAG: hypothetical protein Q8M11_21485 [Sulfuritalea sp.]|jgi:hypothetical protein|nr:hypothetical protein [Sulfuritalea sp.]MDP1983566.1 hypothetical protein [Sulfuritalea sp.]
MKKLMVSFFCIAACSWVSTTYAEVPLPKDISITPPSSDLKKEIAAFSGKWVGNWSGVVEAIFIVEQIGPETAKVIYAVGDAPQWNVSARYWRFDAKVTPSDAAEIEFVTQSGAVFVVKSGGDQSTICMTRGSRNGTETATFKRFAADDGNATLSTARRGNEITKPGPSVPTECSVFSGGWHGEWQTGGYRSDLWIATIEDDCTATYSINGVNGKTKINKSGKTEEFLCLQRTDGRCTFTYSSDDTLKADYWNPSGGSNYATFSRIKGTR